MNGLGLDPVPGLTRLTPETTVLRVSNGPQAQHQLPLTQLRLVIGRNDPPQVTVDWDVSACELGDPPMVSRRHAVVQWVNGTLQLCDLGSRNGTWVDGQRLSPSTPVTLKLGSQIRLGNLELEVMTYGR